MPAEKLKYSPGLNRMHEAVISSHFMHAICNDHRLCLYDSADFEDRVQYVDADYLIGFVPEPKPREPPRWQVRLQASSRRMAPICA